MRHAVLLISNMIYFSTVINIKLLGVNFAVRTSPLPSCLYLLWKAHQIICSDSERLYMIVLTPLEQKGFFARTSSILLLLRDQLGKCPL